MANKATIVHLKQRHVELKLKCTMTQREQIMKNLRLRSGDQMKRCLEL